MTVKNIGFFHFYWFDFVIDPNYTMLDQGFIRYYEKNNLLFFSTFFSKKTLFYD